MSVDLAEAEALVRERGIPAQLSVQHADGQVLADLAVNCPADGLFWIFSASKPFVGLVVHELITRGDLDIDAPVADYWPEFAHGGKGHITLRQVLQHRTGMPTAGHPLVDILTMPSWPVLVRRIERAKPRFTGPAPDPAYQFVIYGHLLGEVVQRVTGEPVARVLDELILRPLGAHDTHLGLTGAQLPRAVSFVGGTGDARAVAAFLNRPHVRRAVIPAAGLSTTAHDLARFYRMLLGGGEIDGVRVVAQESIERMREPSSDGGVDRFIGLPMRWGQGFQLALPPEVATDPFGTLASPNTFGHNGSDCCIGWADPDRGIAFGYLTARAMRSAEQNRHLGRVADAVLRAVDG
ncbi:beta-lactamase family protein [Calidifontibacter sp. DB0510]|uniref:Beta-lactamase family protein n=1 Tax=Metallococcus carri TaxID=1656884 RepID=A0A967B1M2_9MICO|nr:serine hydrolase domain-containing protein [Metallococcus carri]NHN57149.1 beta-lactamase family protein [Metallococcus carri]NOP38048.1 beta-lactamase family protein [Calidifontibacter sp. DB2511S]